MFDRSASLRAVWREFGVDLFELAKYAVGPTVGAVALGQVWPWGWIVYWVVFGLLVLSVLVKLASGLFLHYEKVRRAEAEFELEAARRKRDEALGRLQRAQEERDQLDASLERPEDDDLDPKQ